MSLVGLFDGGLDSVLALVGTVLVCIVAFEWMDAS